MNKELLMNLHMFDGTGDAGSAETGGFASTASGESTEEKPEVLYGKQDEPEDPGQVATGTEETNANDDLSSEFDELIKTKYKDIYSDRIQDTINKRFKNQQDMSNELSAYNDALLPLYSKYGIEAGDYEALSEALMNDESLLTPEAEERGMAVDELKYMKQLEADKARNEQMQARVQAQQAAERDYQSWMKQSEELSDSYPDFDLRTEVQDEKFLGLLRNGWEVKQAYEAIHASDLIARAVGTAANAAQKNVVDNIRARGMRPQENGLGNKAGVIVKDDPSKYTNDDIAEIVRRAENGEKIKL